MSSRNLDLLIVSRQRFSDACLAAAIGAWPLLPAGPPPIPFAPPGAWSDLGLVPVWTIALVFTCLAIGRTLRRAATAVAWRRSGFAWAAFLLVCSGSLIAALAANNDLGSVVFRGNLAVFPQRLWRGLDQGSDPLYPAQVWRTYLAGLATFVLVGLACLTASSPRRRARACLWGAVGGSTMVACIALWQFLSGSRLHPYWVRVNPNLIRTHATLEDPNALGAYLVLTIGAAVGLGLTSRSAAATFAWIAAATCGAALVTTVSRVAWLELTIAAAAIIVGVLPRRPIPRRWSTAALVLVALVALSGLGIRILCGTSVSQAPDDPLSAALVTLDPRTPLPAILKGRDVWWGAAFGMIADFPGAGVGLGRFPRLVESYAADAPMAKTPTAFPCRSPQRPVFPLSSHSPC